MIRAVVDTSVYVSAFVGRPDGAPALVLVAARDRRVRLVASPLLLRELADVLARPKFAAYAGHGRGAAYVSGIAALAERHADADVVPVLTRDEQDDYVAALARLAHADVIVSLDTDLLEAQLPLPCLRPSELLERLA